MDITHDAENINEITIIFPSGMDWFKTLNLSFVSGDLGSKFLGKDIGGDSPNWGGWAEGADEVFKNINLFGVGRYNHSMSLPIYPCACLDCPKEGSLLQKAKKAQRGNANNFRAAYLVNKGGQMPRSPAQRSSRKAPGVVRIVCTNQRWLLTTLRWVKSWN